MLRVCINCYGVTTSDSVYQWDLNHTLAISGADTSKAIAIHFCNKKSTEAIVVPTTIDGDVVTAPIPNLLLQEPHNVIAYLHTTSNDESKTVEIINIPVIARVKPSEYEFIDNEDIYNFEILDGRITDYINSSEARYSEFTEEVNEHIEDKENPHQVTKEQVGLSNVDNTRDVDKPVSTAQQTAIDNAEYNATVKTIAKLATTWSDSVNYVVGDIVSLSDKVYQAILDNKNRIPTSNIGSIWVPIYLGDLLEIFNLKIKPIGTITTVNGDATDVSSQTGTTATTVASVTLAKGIYYALCSVNFPNNSNGFRRINLVQSQNTTTATLGVTSSSAPANGITTSMQLNSILNVTTETTYYLNAQQNSGSTLSVTGQIRAVRII